MHRAARALIAQYASLEQGANTVDEVTVRGRVVHARSLGHKINFFDVVDEAEEEVGDNEPNRPHASHASSSDEDDISNDGDASAPYGTWATRVELVVKYPILTIEQVASICRAVHLGDVVDARGTVSRSDHALELHVRDLAVVHPWDRERLGEFVPQPVSVSATVSALPCKFFLNTGACPRVNCAYAHVRDGDVQYAWIQARMARRQARSHIGLDTEHDPHQKGAHNQRGTVFADWLVNTFTAVYLSSGKLAFFLNPDAIRPLLDVVTGSGVLDIAGGRGDVAFALTTQRGVPCTTIDPRPAKLNKHQYRYLRKHVGAPLPAHVDRMFDAELMADPAHALLLRDATCLVGMHPDEATDAIVEQALALHKPFAVVPCCVFATQFEHRRLDGAPVTTYEQLITYLCAKSPRIQTAFIDVHGRNQVLYCLPDSAGL